MAKKTKRKDPVDAESAEKKVQTRDSDPPNERESDPNDARDDRDSDAPRARDDRDSDAPEPVANKKKQAASPTAAGVTTKRLDVSALARRAALPLAVFAFTAIVYVITLGDRPASAHPDNHYTHLAVSWLEGQLSVVGDRAPGDNDWAHYDGKWFVSFPPFPGAIMLPFVATLGSDALPDRTIWAILAGIAPALMFVLFRFLRESGKSSRTLVEDLGLTALFAFGSVYFFTSVQGTVWFTAHVAACSLLALYVLFSLDARKPIAAGAMLGLLFLTRPTTLLAGVFFVIEAARVAQRPDLSLADDASHFALKIGRFVKNIDWARFGKIFGFFALPALACAVFAIWFNDARFDDPFEFGHRYLQIRWIERINKWGLFNYHYMSKNLAVLLACLPWITANAPYVQVSRHGLALWVTTPHFLSAVVPKRVTTTLVAALLAAGLVAIWNLMYQNSGWIQFGYRFSLDYSVFLFLALAIGGRRFGVFFWVLLVAAIVVNTFGAITFERMWQFYDQDGTQNVLFQPD